MNEVHSQGCADRASWCCRASRPHMPKPVRKPLRQASCLKRAGGSGVHRPSLVRPFHQGLGATQADLRLVLRERSDYRAIREWRLSVIHYPEARRTATGALWIGDLQ